MGLIYLMIDIGVFLNFDTRLEEKKNFWFLLMADLTVYADVKFWLLSALIERMNYTIKPE